MNFDQELLLEQSYTEICEKLASHRLPRWEALPDIELYMDQVVAVMEKALSIYNTESEDNRIITPSIINNYVKLKIIPAPIKKRYNKEHLAYLVMICILKQTLAISSIVKMINLQLEKKSVKQLYNEFCTIYENVIPFVSMEDNPRDGELNKAEELPEDSDDINAFILKSAILSTAGKFICEGVLALANCKDEENQKG